MCCWNLHNNTNIHTLLEYKLQCTYVYILLFSTTTVIIYSFKLTYFSRDSSSHELHLICIQVHAETELLLMMFQIIFYCFHFMQYL